MKQRSITTVVATIAFAFGHAAEPDKAPFASVSVRDHTVIAALPAETRMLVTDGSSEPRLSSPGESFALAENSSLELTEHHSTYHVIARVSPEVGLRVYAVLDARSVGGGITKKHYFIRAE